MDLCRSDARHEARQATPHPSHQLSVHLRLGLWVKSFLVFWPGFFFEVNYRGLEVDRMTVDSSSGTPGAGGLSQYGAGEELEFDNKDLFAGLGGAQLFGGVYLRF